MINIVDEWGISSDNSAESNSLKFNTNIESGQKLYLPTGIYLFGYMAIFGKRDIEFFGGGDTEIKFCGGHSYLGIANSRRFAIYDLIFDGSKSDFEGGVWVEDGNVNGLLKNLSVYDAHSVSCVIGNRSKFNPTYDIFVEDCDVFGQRNWDGNAKAMFLAGGYSYNVTFDNCRTHSLSPRTGLYSPADHFDTDNADAIYLGCVADGRAYNGDGRRGVGFWNEAGGPNSPDHETHSIYRNCVTIETRGGLGVGENSTVVAHNFVFSNSSKMGWAVWSLGNKAKTELHNSLFDGSYSKRGYQEGGVQVRSGTVLLKNNEFKNMGGYNVSLYSADPDAVADVTLEGNKFDGHLRSHGISKGSGKVTLIGNEFLPDAKITRDGNYEWIEKSKTKNGIGKFFSMFIKALKQLVFNLKRWVNS